MDTWSNRSCTELIDCLPNPHCCLSWLPRVGGTEGYILFWHISLWRKTGKGKFLTRISACDFILVQECTHCYFGWRVGQYAQNLHVRGYATHLCRVDRWRFEVEWGDFVGLSLWRDLFCLEGKVLWLLWWFGVCGIGWLMDQSCFGILCGRSAGDHNDNTLSSDIFGFADGRVYPILS